MYLLYKLTPLNRARHDTTPPPTTIIYVLMTAFQVNLASQAPIPWRSGGSDPHKKFGCGVFYGSDPSEINLTLAKLTPGATL